MNWAAHLRVMIAAEMWRNGLLVMLELLHSYLLAELYLVWLQE